MSVETYYNASNCALTTSQHASRIFGAEDDRTRAARQVYYFLTDAYRAADNAALAARNANKRFAASWRLQCDGSRVWGIWDAEAGDWARATPEGPEDQPLWFVGAEEPAARVAAEWNAAGRQV